MVFSTAAERLRTRKETEDGTIHMKVNSEGNSNLLNLDKLKSGEFEVMMTGKIEK
jgi:hypothetical protein